MVNYALDVSSAEPVPATRLQTAARSTAERRILDAALGLFSQHGVSGTSLQMIADAVGVAKAAIYYRFKTKDEIIIAVTASQLAKLEDALEHAEAAKNRTQARNLLLERVIDMAVEQRQTVRILQFDPVIVRFLGEHQPFQQFMGRLYGALLGDDAGRKSRLRIVMLSGAIGSAVMHPLVADIDDETLKAELLGVARQLFDIPD